MIPPDCIECSQGVFCLFDTYPIVLDDQPIGTASVRREGLYAYIGCHFVLDDDLYRIQIEQDNGIIDLGTCLKSGDGYRVDTRIPKKALTENLRFFLIRSSGQNGSFYPIVQGSAFCQLNQLTRGVLHRKDGVLGLLISE